MVILSDTTNKNPKPKVTRAEGLSTFITYYSIVQSSSLYILQSQKSNGKEEPEEPLGIVTEIAAIIFLVAFTVFLPFISKHGIDLTDMHLCGHPLAFFGKQFLNLLPVSIIDIYRHL